MIMSFDQYLYKKRVEKGLIYSKIADMTGISKSSISRYEKGKMGITLEKAMLLAKVFDGSYPKFYESITDRKYQVHIDDKPGENRIYPNVDDISEFEKQVKIYPEPGYKKIADQLNLIIVKAIEKKVIRDINDPEELFFVPSEIRKIFSNNQIHSIELQYPEFYEIWNIIPIYEQGAVIIQDDAFAYCQALQVIVLDRDLHNQYSDEFHSLRYIPMTSKVEDVKLQLILQGDYLALSNGELFYLCTQAVETNNCFNNFDDHPIGRILILISRWRSHLGIISPTNWIDDILAF